MPRRKNPQRKRGNFVSSQTKAKSAIVTQFVRIARKERLDYSAFLYVCQQARRRLGLRKLQRARTLPRLLPETDLKKFFHVLQQCGNVQHEIMLKLLFFSAVRVSELVHVKVTDIDFAQCKIFIAQGKGRKDRYILFPASFRLVLQSHLRANPKNQYLFETVRYMPFTPRRIQQIVQHYREQAGIVQSVHPHLFRHQMITYLTTQGLSAYQEAVKTLDV
jgi:site-specific recombinase XerD